MNERKFVMKLYEEYFLENKWLELLRQGKLSKDAVRRIQQAGLAKSKEAWTKGLEKGNENLIRKLGIKQSNVSDIESKGKPITNLWRSHSMTSVLNPNKKIIYFPKNVPPSKRDLAAIIKRHEIDEVRATSKIKKKAGPYSHYDPRQIKMTGLFSGHGSNEVLRKEKELTNVGAELYGRKSGAGIMRKARNVGGEYDDIGTKASIKKFEKKKLKQYHAEKNDNWISTSPNDIRLMVKFPEKLPLMYKVRLKKIKRTLLPNKVKKLYLRRLNAEYQSALKKIEAYKKANNLV